MRWLALAGVVASGCLLPSVELTSSFGDDGQGGSAGAGAGGTQLGGDTGDAGNAGPPGGANEGGAPPVVDGPPQVLSVSPDDMATDGEPGTAITLTFNEGLDEATIDASSVQVLDGDVPVKGELSYSGVTVTFTPTARLALLANYAVHVSTAVTDSTGTALEQEFTSVFRVRDGAWTEEAPYLDPTLTWGERHAAATDDAGNVLVAWLQSSAASPELSVYARWYHPGSGWDDAVALETETEPCDALTVAASPTGDAVVAWSQQLTLGNYAVYGRRYLNGAWDAGPAILHGGTPSGYSYAPKLLHGAGSDDQLQVAWVSSADQNGIATDFVLSNQANRDGDWRAMQQGFNAIADGDTITDLSLGLTSSGKGLLIWGRKAVGAGGTSIVTSTYAAATQVWTTPVVVPGAEPSANNRVGLALDDAGDGMVIWQKSLPGDSDLMASRFTRGTGFAAGVPLDVLTNTPSFASQQGIVSDGHNFMVGWVQGMGGAANAFANYYDADQAAWQGPELLGDGATFAEYDGPRMAMDRNGNALAAWPQGLMIVEYDVVYSRRTDGVWATGQPITTLDEPYSGVELVGAPNGVAMALIDLGNRDAASAELTSFFASFE